MLEGAIYSSNVDRLTQTYTAEKMAQFGDYVLYSCQTFWFSCIIYLFQVYIAGHEIRSKINLQSVVPDNYNIFAYFKLY